MTNMGTPFSQFHSTDWADLHQLHCTQPEMEVHKINWKIASNQPHKDLLAILDVAKNHSSYSVTVITPVFPSQHLITQSSLIKSWKIPPDVSSAETNS